MVLVTSNFGRNEISISCRSSVLVVGTTSATSVLGSTTLLETSFAVLGQKDLSDDESSADGQRNTWAGACSTMPTSTTARMIL